jgi:hypothetical protein
LLQIGTGASGGPYVSARECPTGTAGLALVIPVAVFVMLFGAFVYGGRGVPPGGTRKGDAFQGVLFIWLGVFLGIAFACFWGVWGPDADPGPGAKSGGLIVGFLFVPLGLLGLVPLLGARKATQAATEATGVSIGDTLKMARGARKVDMSALVTQMQEKAAENRSTGFGGDAMFGSPSPGESSGADVLGELERLQRLRDQGVINEDEFQRLKARVIE